MRFRFWANHLFNYGVSPERGAARDRHETRSGTRWLARAWFRRARKIEFVEVIQNDLLYLSHHSSMAFSDFQKLSLTLDPNHLLISRHPVPREGALAIVTDVGAGSGGRESCD
jgi:hypothetical protein